MASWGKKSGESLKGRTYIFDAYEGTFTEKTVYDKGGQIKSGSNYKVGELSAPIAKGDLVKIYTSGDRKVQKVAANDTKTANLVGFAVDAPFGDPETGRQVLVQELAEGDVLRLTAGGALAVGDKVKISALAAAEPHGIKVTVDNTNGIGYCLNSTAADGETVLVWLKPGTY